VIVSVEAGPRSTGESSTATGRIAGAVRVLLVDERGLFADPLASVLAQDDRIEVAGTARSGDEAVALAALIRPAVVLMDHDIPTSTGVPASWVIRETLPAVYVVMLDGSRLLSEIDGVYETDAVAGRDEVASDLLSTIFEICPAAAGRPKAVALP
jgi:CheY-like chemotaxis protein